MAKYTDIARKQGKDFITLDSGMSDHYVCCHCEAWSQNIWDGGRAENIKHKPGCPMLETTNDR